MKSSVKISHTPTLIFKGDIHPNAKRQKEKAVHHLVPR